MSKIRVKYRTRKDIYGTLEKNNFSKEIEVKAKLSKPMVNPEHKDPNNSTTWGKNSRYELCECISGRKIKIVTY